MPGLLLAAGVLWIAYDATTGQWPVIAANSGTVGLDVALILAQWRFK